MIHSATIQKQQVGTGYYVDSGNKRHPVIHSIAVSAVTQEEKIELEERIAEDILHILSCVG